MIYTLKTWQQKSIQHNLSDPWFLKVVNGQVIVDSMVRLESGEVHHRGRLLEKGESVVLPSWADFVIFAYMWSTIQLNRR